MRVFLKIVLGCCLLSLGGFVNAQESKEAVIERCLEQWIANANEEQDYTDWVQNLEELYEQPIPINTATVEELERLPMLSDILIANLLKYREQVGQMYSIYELQAVKGFSPELLNDLQYFLSFKPITKQKLNLKNAVRYGRHSLLLRGKRYLGERKGYQQLNKNDFPTQKAYKNWQNRRYLGSPWGVYLRYQSHYKDKIQLGLVAEKDAGEEFFTGSQKRGFDHYSGYVQVRDMGIFKTIIVGDYLPRFGQGLAVWGGFSMAKSGYFLNENKRNEGLKKYASTNENQYFRGVGVTVNPFRRLSLTAYYSQKKIDGSLRTFSANKEDYFTSFLQSGYHRSLNEIAKRKVIGEQIFGANANYMYQNLKVGANFIDYSFSKPFEPQNLLRNQFRFRGNHGLNYSFYANYRYKRLFFFSEVGMSQNKAKAFLGGLVCNASERLRFAMLYRNYAKDYNALYANGFSEKSGTTNESGWYLGMEFLPWAKWKLSTYFDMYEFPWLRSGSDAPSRGFDGTVRLEYRHSQKLYGYLQFYHQENEKNTTLNAQKIHSLTPEKRTKLRLQVDYDVSPTLVFKDRLEMALYEKEAKKHKGFVIYHDIVWHSTTLPVSLTARCAFFDVEDYQARIYTYENDVLYAFSIPALYNKGLRWYCNAKWQINAHFTVWAKYSLTKYQDEDQIGSSLDELSSDTLQELKLQLRYQF